jgi:hypothetical protein
MAKRSRITSYLLCAIDSTISKLWRENFFYQCTLRSGILLKAGTNGHHIIEKFRDKCPLGSELCTGLHQQRTTLSIFLSFRYTAPYKLKIEMEELLWCLKGQCLENISMSLSGKNNGLFLPLLLKIVSFLQNS